MAGHLCHAPYVDADRGQDAARPEPAGEPLVQRHLLPHSAGAHHLGDAAWVSVVRGGPPCRRTRGLGADDPWNDGRLTPRTAIRRRVLSAVSCAAARSRLGGEDLAAAGGGRALDSHPRGPGTCLIWRRLCPP